MSTKQKRPTLIASILLGMVLAASSSATPVQAQTQITQSSILPQVFVTAISANPPGNQDHITGTFTVRNDEQHPIDGLHYQIQLLGPAPEMMAGQFTIDQAPEYDRIVAAESFSILPQTTDKIVPFTYQPPHVPEGEYRLRIRLVTATAVQLGWLDTAVTLGSPTVAFATVSQTGLTLPDGQTIPATRGVTVNPTESLQAVITFHNSTPYNLHATPKIVTYYRDITGDTVSESQNPSTVTITSQGQQSSTIPITAPTKPGPYYTIITLVNEQGQTVSSQASFAYQVAGVSAKVVTAFLQNVQAGTQQPVTLVMTLAGAADHATTVQAQITSELLNDGQVVGSATQSATLALDPVSVTLPITPTAPLTKPGFRITVTSPDTTILDTYEVTSTLTEAELASLSAATEPTPTESPKSSGRLILTASLIVIAITLVSILIRLIYRQRTTNVTASLVVLAVMGSGALAASWYLDMAHAASILGPTNSLFVNTPVDYGIYGRTVPFSVSVLDLSCPQCTTSASNKAFEGSAVIIGHTQASGWWPWTQQAGVLDDAIPSAQTDITYEIPYTWSTNCDPTYSSGSLCGKMHNLVGAVTLPATFPGSQVTWQIMHREQRGSTQAYRGRAITYTGLTDEAQCVGMTAPTQIKSGESFPVTVTLKNIGTSVWQPNSVAPAPLTGGRTFSPLQYHVLSGGSTKHGVSYSPFVGQLNIDQAIQPGETKTFTYTARTTASSGTHPLLGYAAVTGSGARLQGPFGTACQQQITIIGVTPLPPTSTPHRATPTPTPRPSTPTPVIPTPTPVKLPQCSDGLDNDGDTRADCADPACHISHDINKACDATFNTEKDPQCSDLKDNDGDGTIDSADPGCRTHINDPTTYNPADTNEVNVPFNPGGFQEVE